MAFPENSGAVARLNESLANAALAPSPGLVPALPQAGSDMSGHAYALAPNLLDVAGLRLTFDGTAQAELVLSTSVAKFSLASARRPLPLHRLVAHRSAARLADSGPRPTSS
ncbi:MAG: hypothetical protein U0263_39885 [Polyangiaceae bacterium]